MFRVSGEGFRVSNGCRVQCSGLRLKGLGFGLRVEGKGFRDCDLGFRVEG